MNRLEILQKIENSGVIAVIRLNGDENLDQIIVSLSKGGITAIEIIMTTPNSVEYIRKFSNKYATELLIGAGTVLNADTTKRVIGAGVEFMRAGAVFLGVDTALFDKKIIKNENWLALQHRALQFKSEVEKGRAGLPAYFEISEMAEGIVT